MEIDDDISVEYSSVEKAKVDTPERSCSHKLRCRSNTKLDIGLLVTGGPPLSSSFAPLIFTNLLAEVVRNLMPCLEGDISDPRPSISI